MTYTAKEIIESNPFIFMISIGSHIGAVKTYLAMRFGKQVTELANEDINEAIMAVDNAELQQKKLRRK